jgi:enoyl-CoA hydratase
MVSKIFPEDQLADRTLEFAERIATLPTMAALLIKESVNQTMDSMGFTNALNSCFTIHQLNHSYWATLSDAKRWVAVADFDEGVQDWRTAPPVEVARVDRVGGVAAGA